MQQGVVRKRRPTPLSEYGRQLKEKQDLRTQYRLREKQLKNYVKRALESTGKSDSPEVLVQALERRLDNVIFRAGMAQSRAQARQMVTHGHFHLKGRRVDIPSLQTKKGDVISVRPSSLETPMFKNVLLSLKKVEPPSWISLDKEKAEIRIQGLPTVAEASLAVEIPLIFEYYSR